MDAAIFRRSKVELLAWIVTPALLLLLVAIMFQVTWRGMKQDLADRVAFIEMLPGLEADHAASRDLLAMFVTGLEDIDPALDALAARINSNAEGRLTIEEVRLAEAKDEDFGVAVLRASLQGVGELMPLMQFLADMRASGGLVGVTALQLRAMTVDPNPRYEFELELDFYAVPSE